jgi:hypothetical protein
MQKETKQVVKNEVLPGVLSKLVAELNAMKNICRVRVSSAMWGS